MIHVWIRRVPARRASDPDDHGLLFRLKMDEINHGQTTYSVSVAVGHWEPPDHFPDFTYAKLAAWLAPATRFRHFVTALKRELPLMGPEEIDCALQFTVRYWNRVITLIQGPIAVRPNFRFARAGGVRDLLTEFVDIDDNLHRAAPEWAPVGNRLYVLSFTRRRMRRNVTVSADWIWTFFLATRTGETGYRCLACPDHDRNGLDDFVNARRAWNHLVQALNLQLADPPRRR